MYWPNLKSVALPVPEVIPTEILGGVASPNHEEESTIGGWGFIFYSIFTHFDRHCRFCAPACHFSHPTSSLPKISSVPLGLCSWPLGYEEQRASFPCNLSARFPT